MNNLFSLLTFFLLQFFIAFNLAAANNVPVFLIADIHSTQGICYNPWQQTEVTFYDIRAAAQVNDIDGIDDIVSVVLLSPDGSVFKTLYDEGLHNDGDAHDGYYVTEAIENSAPPVLGNYRLVVTDKDDHSNSQLVSVDRYLDIPGNPAPYYEEYIDNPTPTFSWDEVDDADSYSVSVTDPAGKPLWKQGGITSTSVLYNNDGTGENLSDGSVYAWQVISYTKFAHSSHEIPFIFSSTDDQDDISDNDSSDGEDNDDEGDQTTSDNDGDGFALNDCDDSDSSVYPGAQPGEQPALGRHQGLIIIFA